MRVRLFCFTAAVFFLILSPRQSVAQQASIREEKQSMTTYPFFDVSPLPGMAINKKVAPFYPYSIIDGYSSKPVSQPWQVITMDNKYIRVAVMPGLGGKVLGAIEKSTGQEFVYWNHVVKFRAIGIRGPWTSGGIEHNFGLDLGHAPWAAGPVDYAMIMNPDSSVTCVVGGLDLASRSEWRVKINLPKDKAYFETEALWFNPLPLHQAYLSWENATFRASNDLQFFFPGNHHIGHDGLANPWPVDNKGRDLSYYRNNNFGESKSYHVVGDYRNWFGGYWKDSAFGFGHWSSYTDAPGKKLWIWSLARDGAIWEDLLTDKDGQYIEAQSGVKLNQAAERSGYHSPFRQLSHKPLYGETKTDYWFPVKGSGNMVDANPYGTMDVDIRHDSLIVSVSPLQELNDSLVIRMDGKQIAADAIHFKPMLTFNKILSGIDTAGKIIKVDIGNGKLLYTMRSESRVSRPVRADEKFIDTGSGERLFRMAEEQNAMRNFGEAMALYQQCIEKEPSHTEALDRLAELCYRKGNYEDGLQYARQVLTLSAYDGAGNYIYAALQEKLDHPDDAAEAYSIAARTMEFRSASYTQLAGLQLKKKNFSESIRSAQIALDFNPYNLTAANSLITVLRKNDQRAESEVELKKLLHTDPLNQYGKFERFLLSGAENDKNDFVLGIQNEFPAETFLELAIQYVHIGLSDEAVQVLKLAPPTPIVCYWLAYLYRDSTGNATDEWLSKAETPSAKLVFPFRPETLSVLVWAQQKHASWETLYYSGLICWNNGNISKAKIFFEQCGQQPDLAAAYLSRAILNRDDSLKKSGVMDDIARAKVFDPKEWRTWSTESGMHESTGSFDRQLQNAADAYRRFSTVPVIQVDYARALLNTHNTIECLKVLRKTRILPQEGAKEGHELFEMANVASALQRMEKNKYREAIPFLEQAKQYPESLGEGKPYDPDYRLIDYLLGFCEKKSGNAAAAAKHEQSIMDFSADAEKFLAARNPGSQYIGLITLKKNKRPDEAESLLQQWDHSLDSLNTWEISDQALSPQVQWVRNKFKDPATDMKALENRIAGSGKETQFTLFLRALALTGDGKK